MIGTEKKLPIPINFSRFRATGDAMLLMQFLLQQRQMCTLNIKTANSN